MTSPPLVADRLTAITTVIADPPRVHDSAPSGVWGTSTDCYQFIARNLPDGARTLETGLGISTVLLGLWSARHTCVVGSAAQVDALKAYLLDHGQSHLDIGFEVGTSDQVLPSLVVDPIDLYLIDGGHGFPIPVVDWYYGSQFLRAGGLVIVDDIQLPSVHDYLIRYLNADPRWTRVGGDHKWLAFRKEGDFTLQEEWTGQDFLGPRRQPASTRLKSSVHRRIERLRQGWNNGPANTTK
ncbi:class I SAM-dependent methyltransferase [Knoellia aerolata]|uniref:O-methyltransferase n=1 Tax=Knoellia aerolata DSM 18566 TaxID=1385519 RepID=A0A0A0JW20_9MICO|nr:class I SAM-dependent methyltransferase [Knoellia aerolata]KGN41393.1 hypothetical protein N801_07535 [Knoellia aerolata DSM 18566]